MGGLWRLTLILALVSWPVALAGTRCQIERPADAHLRLDVWGRELAGAKGRIAAHSARRVAWLADRQGVVIEALFLVTVQDAGAPARSGGSPRRPRWVRCTDG
jgi:hypothetical protein